ncbi:putative NOT transcription complex subunit VIP2 [Hordeum vulgare]|nr:putative NOT transcription complex subunit VIP2 [Hordeum vulgare]
MEKRPWDYTGADNIKRADADHQQWKAEVANKKKPKEPEFPNTPQDRAAAWCYVRYNLKDELLEIYRKEETYWRQRGSLNLVLFGDANTSYFQAIANGHRCRCTIPLLWDGDRLIQEPGEIWVHVDGFYKGLFAARPRSGVALDESIWDVRKRVSLAENRALLAPFDEVEVAAIIKEMNPSPAPGPDGLPVQFFQKFWHSIKRERDHGDLPRV